MNTAQHLWYKAEHKTSVLERIKKSHFIISLFIKYIKQKWYWMQRVLFPLQQLLGIHLKSFLQAFIGESFKKDLADQDRTEDRKHSRNACISKSLLKQSLRVQLHYWSESRPLFHSKNLVLEWLFPCYPCVLGVLENSSSPGWCATLWWAEWGPVLQDPSRFYLCNYSNHPDTRENLFSLFLAMWKMKHLI